MWGSLLSGVLAFVFEYRALYFASPLTILDIRDGGWNAGVGLVVAWPDLAFSSVEGKTVTLREFTGKSTLVNLWATWCPPCAREMPVLQKAQVERQDIHFVSLNPGEDPIHVDRWLRARGLSLQNVLVDEPRRASAVFKQQGCPTTLFFDANGSLVSRRIGELSAPTLSQQLHQITQ